MNRRALLAAGAVLPFAGAVRAEAPSAGRLVTHASFSSAHVQARNVSVWLPPGYEASDARHPVLYCTTARICSTPRPRPSASGAWTSIWSG